MSALSEWLEARGLGALRSVLEAQQIDLDILPELTEGDLKDLGIALGPRRRLLRAIGGADVASSPAVPSSGGDGPPAVDTAERRQLSVLFVDLVGSTTLSSRRDPEEMRQIVRRYQNAVAGEVTRFDGYVAKFMGDGVLAYFGWPKAHEDEAERAVRAAMAAVAAVAELRTGEGEALAARAGVATGLVVVGDLIGEGVAQEAAAVGDTPNIAARVQALAQPGQVLIADSTQRLVKSTFDVNPLGPQKLRGLDRPVATFSVQRERTSDSRFEARHGERLRPMVGRDQELALLQERWAEARRGDGQCLLLVGEAGIGKSRITRALLDLTADSDSVVLRFQCSPYHLDSAWWPVLQQLSFAARITGEDAPDVRLDKVEALLADVEGVDRAVPLIAALLGIPYEDRYGSLDLSPQLQRIQTLSTLVGQLSALARRRPILMVMEDMHWTDPSTLEFVHLVLDGIEGQRILILLTSRPDGQPALAGHPQVTRLVLNRLGRAAVEAMTATIEGSVGLSEAVRQEILARTDGVPLFVEELTRALVELAEQQEGGAVDSARPEKSVSVPATLHDSLMSRLDRTPEVKRVAQVAACIGRVFDYRTLAEVAGVDAFGLNSALERLVDAELIFNRGTPPESIYTFKHALVRDAAANSLLHSEFRRVNGAIAAAFEKFEAQPPPERIAWHAELAGQERKAVDYLLIAGSGAVERYANREAINHLEHALRLIPALPDAKERGLLEIKVLAMVGVPRIALHGYAAAAVEGTYRRMVELADESGDKVQLFQGLRGLWNCVYDRASIENAREIAERLCTLALEHPAAEALGLAYRALGAACLSLGRVQDAIDAFERGVSACAGLPADAGLREHGESPFIIGSAYAGYAHVIAGNIDRGLAFFAEALDGVRLLQNPVSFAFAYHLASDAQFLMGEPAECARLNAESSRVSEEHHLVFWIAAADIMDGWVAAQHAGDTAGVDRMRRGLHAWQTSGAELHIPTWNAAIAEGLLATGAIDDAGETIDRALALARERGEMFAVPILLRLKGLVADRQGDVQASEALLRQAIAMSGEQGARLYQLRASHDLARLMVRRGDRAAARELLGEACGGIRGGATVACVVDSRKLLAALT